MRPSGCRKSTALRMVAGLETISEGNLLIGNKVVNDLSSGERDIAMVFQSEIGRRRMWGTAVAGAFVVPGMVNFACFWPI